MADLTKDICGNCGEQTVYFCSNEFTDYWCKSCGAVNLFVALHKIETRIPCKPGFVHDIRIAKGDKLFCPRCWKEFGVLRPQ